MDWIYFEKYFKGQINKYQYTNRYSSSINLIKVLDFPVAKGFLKDEYTKSWWSDRTFSQMSDFIKSILWFVVIR